jgi:CRP-like cAMP-binding protein
MIDINILLNYNGLIKEYFKDETIIAAGEEPKYYFQILEGKVKMSNFNEEGKEFIQGIFTCGESFGEPPLFIENNYPANAIALIDSRILIIKKEDFFDLLTQDKESCFGVFKALSNRLYYKSIMAPDISSHDSYKRILTLLNYLKNQSESKEEEFLVNLTRQQIADLTGLRVETVIRSIKELEARNQIRISRGKLFI